MNPSQKVKYFSDYMSTGDISKSLGFLVKSDFIKNELGIPASVETSTGYFWHKSLVPTIYMAISARAAQAGLRLMMENKHD